MLGNIVTGCSVLAPAGMLSELSSGLDVSIRDAGLLITFGAVVLCIGSPVTAWLTSRIERRTLLDGDAGGARARPMPPRPSRPTMPACWSFAWSCWRSARSIRRRRRAPPRLIVPAEKRGSTIAYIFLGWSLAAAVGLPLITFIASRYGWRAAYGGIGAIGCRQFSAAGVAAAGRTDRRAGRSQDLDRCRRATG